MSLHVVGSYHDSAFRFCVCSAVVFEIPCDLAVEQIDGCVSSVVGWRFIASSDLLVGVGGWVGIVHIH